LCGKRERKKSEEKISWKVNKKKELQQQLKPIVFIDGEKQREKKRFN